MADNAASTSVGEIFLALGISPESIQKMLETIRASTAQATAQTSGNPVTINITVNAQQVQNQVQHATEVAAAEAKAAPVEIPVKVDPAPVVEAVKAVKVEVAQASTNSAAFGHDFTHTLEIIGNAAQRLRGGLAEISHGLRELVGEAKAGAQAEEVAFARMKNVLGDNNREGKEFVETMAKARQNLTAAQIATATTEFYNFGKSLGYTNEEALESSKKFVNLGADLAKVNAKPLEEVMDALRTQLLRGGNSAAQYGIRIKEAEVQQEAWRIAAHGTEEELTQEELAIARTNIIMRQSADIHEKVANATTTLASRQKVLSVQTGELLVQVGKYSVEMAGPMVEAMIKVVTWFRSFADEHPTLTKGLVVLATVATGLITALTGLAIVTEIAISVKTGLAGIATILGVQTAVTTAATGAAGAHAIAMEGEAVAAGHLAVASGAASKGVGLLGAASGLAATVIGTMWGVLGLSLGAIAGLGAGAIAAAAGLILLAVAIGAFAGWLVTQIPAVERWYKRLEKSAEKSNELAAANERLAKSGATQADAAAVQADAIQKLIEAKKLDASWTEILTKQATADIAMLRKHSQTVDEAAERIQNYNRYLAEGRTTNEAFAQSISKMARLAALTDIKRNGTLSAEQTAERDKIIASLTEEEKVRAGLIKLADVHVDKEQNAKKVLEQQKKIHEEIAALEKKYLDVRDAGREAEAHAIKDLERRAQMEKAIILDKAQAEKAELHEKLGLKGDSPARQVVDQKVDDNAALAIRNLEAETARQLADIRIAQETKVRNEILKTADEASHAEAEVGIARLKNTDAYAAALATVQLSQNEAHTQAIRNYYEELKALQERGATQDELAAHLKAYQVEEANRVKKFAAERAKLAIEDAKKREDAYKSSDKAALDAELQLEEARAKAKESLDDELAILKRREAEELKQAVERGAEARELANIKRKFAAEALKQIEDNARAAEKAAKAAADAGRKALNDQLAQDDINKDKREGRVSKAAFKETENKLDAGLGNIHSKADADDFKKHTKNALTETFEEQKKNVDKLNEEAKKAQDDQEKNKNKRSTPKERAAVEADVAEKVKKAADAQKEFAKATEDAVAAQKRLDAKADIAADNAALQEKAQKRLTERAKQEAAGDAKPADAAGGAAPADGLAGVAQNLTKAASEVLDANKLLPVMTQAINGLISGQSAFFKGLTDFGTSVVEKISAQQKLLSDLTSKVTENKAALDKIGNKQPDSNDNSAAALGGA